MMAESASFRQCGEEEDQADNTQERSPHSYAVDVLFGSTIILGVIRGIFTRSFMLEVS